MASFLFALLDAAQVACSVTGAIRSTATAPFQIDPKSSTPKSDEEDDDQQIKEIPEGSKHDSANSHLATAEMARTICTTTSSVDSTKQEQQAKGFRFMELPTELRLKIYKELLVHPGGIHINKKIRTYYETVARHSESCAVVGTCSKRCAIYRLTKQRCPRQPVFPKRCCVETAILATCKSIREEAYDILWKQPWHFSDPETLHSFLMLLGPKTINSLRNITIHQGLYKRDMRHFAFLAPLQYATNLQVLQFGTAIVEIRRDPNSEWQRGHIIAEAFFKKMSPFVRAFTTRRGVEELLQVVKFDGVDMEGSQLVGTWTEEREKIFCDSLRIRLVQLMSR